MRIFPKLNLMYNQLFFRAEDKITSDSSNDMTLRPLGSIMSAILPLFLGVT